MSEQRLTNVLTYDIKNLVLRKEYEVVIPKSNPPIKYKIVPIATRFSDGTLGDMLITTEANLFSFGITENKSIETGKIIGYSLPLCCWNMDAPTDREKRWTSKIEEMVVEIRKVLDSRHDLFYNPENKLFMKSPFYWKTEKGKRVEGKGPTMYPKLITGKSDDRIDIRSIFYSSGTDNIDPLTLLKQRCRVTAVIKFESIRIAPNAVTLQVKLQEAKITLTNKSIRRLLEVDDEHTPVPSTNIYNALRNDEALKEDTADEAEKTPKADNSDEETETQPPASPVKTKKAKIAPRKK